MSLISAFLDLLFPPRCVFCRGFVKSGAALFCEQCRKSLPYTRDGGERHGDFFARCVSPLYYEKDVRESILRYKFRDAAGYAGVYGTMLAGCIRERLAGQYDLISWVPLSRKRLRQRGYDQAKLLAEAAAKELGEPLICTLEKLRDVAKQSQTGSAEKRRANIAGVYRVPAPSRIADKRVLLIDDIVTTGSTLSECARTLRAAGAKSVVCATLARTGD